MLPRLAHGLAGSFLLEEETVMPGRGPQTFKKRQKEQERRERQQEKFAKRLQRKAERAAGGTASSDIESPEEHTGDEETAAENRE
jgi:hypothetical protein